MDLGMKTALRRHIKTYMDSQQVDLLTLRDTLQELANEVNETYMNAPELYTHICRGFGDMSSCGVRFSILDNRKEDRRPETCVECWEKDHPGKRSGLREPQYDYKRYETERPTLVPTGEEV